MGNIFVHQIKKGRKTKQETLDRLTSSLKRELTLLNSYIDANNYRGIISSLSTIDNTSKNIKEVYLTVVEDIEWLEVDLWLAKVKFEAINNILK